jgi:rubrerythrin
VLEDRLRKHEEDKKALRAPIVRKSWWRKSWRCRNCGVRIEKVRDDKVNDPLSQCPGCGKMMRFL